MKKDNSIVIWRIFFAYVIVAYHFLNAYGFGSSLYLATDFFFIVSGFLLAYEAESKKYDSPLEMLVHKLKKYYPHYILSFVVTYIVFMCFKIKATPDLTSVIPELFLVQMIGINLTEMINVPTWYLSVLLISSYFIYFLLINYKKIFIQFIIPIVLIISGTWFYRNYGYVSHTSLGEDLTTGIYWNIPLILGFSMICIGILTYYFLQKISLESVRKCSGGVKSLFEVLIFVGITVSAVIYRKTAFDFIAIILMTFAVMMAFSNNSFTFGKSKIVRYFSRLSYPLYLNHNLFRKLFPQFWKFSFRVFILYLLIVTVYSMLTMLLIELIQKNIYERKNGNGKNNYSSSTSERK